MCYFCQKNVDDVDFKNIELLSKFISGFYKIKPRKKTNLCSYHQKKIAAAIKRLDVFSKVSLLELRLYLANMLLRDGDFMSMAHGLEVRVPFLDHELVEYVFAVPQELKVDNVLPKPLLINAVKDLLPETIYLRKKMGFTFPWESWLKHRLRAQIYEVFNGFPANNEVGLDVRKCQGLLHMFLQNKPYVTWPRVWAIYVLMSWARKNMLK